MTEPADFEHDLATQVLIELYSEIPPPSKLVTGHFHSGGDYRVVRPDGRRQLVPALHGVRHGPVS